MEPRRSSKPPSTPGPSETRLLIGVQAGVEFSKLKRALAGVGLKRVKAPEPELPDVATGFVATETVTAMIASVSSVPGVVFVEADVVRFTQ